MKFCSNCGEEVKEGAEFCPNCGKSLKKKNTVDKSTTDSRSDDQNVDQKSSSIKEESKESFSQLKELIQENGYFNFIKNSLTNPSSIETTKNSYYGWIHLVILSILFTLSIYLVIRGSAITATRSIGVGYQYGAMETVKYGLSIIREILIPRLSIVTFITYLTYPLSAFITLKFFEDAKITFNQLLNNLTRLFTVNIVILLVSILFSLIFKAPSILGFSMILIVLTLPLTNLAYNYYIFSNVIGKKMDKYYTVLISNLLLFFFSFIIAYIQMDAFVSIIEEIEYYL